MKRNINHIEEHIKNVIFWEGGNLFIFCFDILYSYPCGLTATLSSYIILLLFSNLICYASSYPVISSIIVLSLASAIPSVMQSFQTFLMLSFYPFSDIFVTLLPLSCVTPSVTTLYFVSVSPVITLYFVSVTPVIISVILSISHAFYIVLLLLSHHFCLLLVV